MKKMKIYMPADKMMDQILNPTFWETKLERLDWAMKDDDYIIIAIDAAVVDSDDVEMEDE